MKPLHVRVEIDAFIADRLLEAVWREALWLINDGVATTEEIDDAIRLRVRAALGSDGIVRDVPRGRRRGRCGALHSPVRPDVGSPVEQVDRCPGTQRGARSTPWYAQSDAQSGKYTTRELERVRDRNLVGILKALETNNWAAGTNSRQNNAADSAGGA